MSRYGRRFRLPAPAAVLIVHAQPLRSRVACRVPLFVARGSPARPLDSARPCPARSACCAGGSDVRAARTRSAARRAFPGRPVCPASVRASPDFPGTACALEGTGAGPSRLPVPGAAGSCPRGCRVAGGDFGTADEGGWGAGAPGRFPAPVEQS
ncbi:hypothetical protein ATKI12_0070 [Kitasatospora sp. Ki12]